MLDSGCTKLITFAIPCYNSAEYMDTCVNSILAACVPHDGADDGVDVPAAADADFEVVIVDDGSTKDDTPAKADAWARRYPGVISAVHQENGGHGAAVLTGIAHARGMYYKVVDSDDWIDRLAGRKLLADMRRLVASGQAVDLFVSNYVYEHVLDDTRTPIGYSDVLPTGRVFTWDEMGKFRLDQNLLMHSLTYRTSVLRDGGVPLPSHTFYVDNIFAYVPLPRCATLYYEDADVYRYYIGRQDQSVNEQVMTSRYDQQLRITRIMIDAYHLYDDIASVPLRNYMLNYFTMMMTISSVFSHLSKDPDAEANLSALWDHLKKFDERMYSHARHGVMGVFTNLPGDVGHKISTGLYRLARKVVKFN
jgi:glycosyltransferase involved in cell wall biosynthesis